MFCGIFFRMSFKDKNMVLKILIWMNINENIVFNNSQMIVYFFFRKSEEFREIAKYKVNKFEKYRYKLIIRKSC